MYIQTCTHTKEKAVIKTFFFAPILTQCMYAKNNRTTKHSGAKNVLCMSIVLIQNH